MKLRPFWLVYGVAHGRVHLLKHNPSLHFGLCTDYATSWEDAKISDLETITSSESVAARWHGQVASLSMVLQADYLDTRRIALGGTVSIASSVSRESGGDDLSGCNRYQLLIQMSHPVPARMKVSS